jgi:hypothetical protein
MRSRKRNNSEGLPEVYVFTDKYIDDIEQMLISGHIKNIPSIKDLKKKTGMKFPRVKDCPIVIDMYNKLHNRPAPVYNILGSRLVYKSPKGTMIPKGTCFPESVLNFYKSELTVGTDTITTYRFGTHNHHFKSIDDFKKVFVKSAGKKELKKPFINISLLGLCNTSPCDTLAKSSRLPTFAREAFRENSIINIEKNYNKSLNSLSQTRSRSAFRFETIFIPIRPQKFLGKTWGLMDKENLDSIDFDKHFNNMRMMAVKGIKDPIGENTFKTLVNIFAYHFNFCKNEYNMGFHCRSSKDRTSVLDAIAKATYYYLMTQKQKSPDKKVIIDYKKIRKLVPYFLLIGLIIAYRSTRVVGLKIKLLPLAKYLLEPKLIEFFSGVYA